MTEKVFAHLNPLSFLQTFITLSLSLSKKSGTDLDNNIEQLGFSAGCCFETAYKQEFNINGTMNHDKCAEMIIEIKNKIGGNFSRTSSDPNTIRVINTRCPFGNVIKQTPELCKMTSSVFGGIVARNFGYAKVVFRQKIATGNRNCDVQIFTDLSDCADYAGDEYHWRIDNDNKRKLHLTQGVASGKDGSKEIMKDDWCILGDMEEKRPIPNIVADSIMMKDILKMAKKIANSLTAVLITGETGVGKEVIARLIHMLSPRWKRQFVGVNCGAIPENLVESAIFGHEKGAFTGAHQVHHGYFERAEGGTLFLDEIDSLSLSAQVKLLRITQEKEFERVGGKQTLSCDVRIISATNADMEKLVSADRFRRDLYYRINVINLHIPPLRQRPEDILPLSEYILDKFAIKHGIKAVLSHETISQLYAYDWPGNVRELENVLERSLLLSDTEEISEIAMLPIPVENKSTADNYKNMSFKTVKKQVINIAETQLLEKTLADFNGNITSVAKHLGVTTRTIYKKINILNINPMIFRHKIK